MKCLFAKISHVKLCKTSFDESPTSNMVPSVVHHFNVLSLLAFANVDHCYMCQMLLSNLKLHFPKAFEVESLESLRIETCWSRHSEANEKDTLFFILTDFTQPRVPTWNWSCFFRLNAWPTETFAHYFKDPDRANAKLVQPAPSDMRTPDPEALANTWLTQCVANKGHQHELCNAAVSSFVPTRLLDVESAKVTGYLRLVLPDRSPGAFKAGSRWITLSYCWGSLGAEKSPLLKQSNLVDRTCTGLRTGDLPQSFQDAIEVASWFNGKG